MNRSSAVLVLTAVSSLSGTRPDTGCNTTWPDDSASARPDEMSTASSSSPAAQPTPLAAPGHSAVDDLQAGATAVILVSLGLSLFHSAGLMTGGTPGLAFLISYSSGLPLGVALFIVNLPFYLL